MASTRASTSRLSLDDWEALAPLSPKQQHSAATLQHQVVENTSRSRPPTPATPRLALDTVTAGAGGRHTHDAADAANEQEDELDALVAGHIEPISSSNQFHEWFSRVEAALDRDHESVYVDHLAQLRTHVSNCRDVLSALDHARALVSEIEANNRYVDENSAALQLACETLLEEQRHLVEVTEALSERLAYFRQLEKATRMLNLPGEDLVLNDDFLNLVDRLDACLDYLRAHPDFVDAEIYTIRFQQCLTRAMTLIKMYFVSTVRRIATQVAEKMAGKDLSETAQNALLYSKFSSAAPTLRILLFELEKRAHSDPTEYSSLLSECYSTWFAARTQLLSPLLAEEVRRMDPGASSTDLVKLAKAGCGYLRGVCAIEWNLFREYFSSGQEDLYRFLESLCDYLYDSLRPRILHEPRLDALCDLCAVLHAMMALDASTSGPLDPNASDDDDDADLIREEEEEEEEDAATQQNQMGTTTTTTLGHGFGSLRFAVLLQTILQDAQTRLVFRAQAVIQSDVLHYQPTPDDLDYPEKLLRLEAGEKTLWHDDDEQEDVDEGPGGARGGPPSRKEKHRAAAAASLFDAQVKAAMRGAGPMAAAAASKLSARFKAPSEQTQKTWFPTLKRTVWVLSRLDAYVNDAIFQDFAGEAVTLCRQSLASASLLIAARPPSDPISPTAADRKSDGYLFMIRHLLLLKEMVRSVDLVQVERGPDFSSLTEALSLLLRNTSSLFNPRTLVDLASKGMPSFAETMTDAKTDLDAALKVSCEELIAHLSHTLTASLRTFLDRCTAFLSSPSAKAGDLVAQEWASPNEVLQLHANFRDTVRTQTGSVVKRMRIFLVDDKTVGVLVPPLWEDVVDTYSTFYNLIRSEYGFDTSSTLVAPQEIHDELNASAGREIEQAQADSSRATELVGNAPATKRTSPEKAAEELERVSKRTKAAAEVAEAGHKPAPLDPLLVSRFAGARHQRKDVEAILRRFPALCQRNFFVIQEHHATAKHFDLRLQLDDELLSWAIPRGFSLNKEEQALGKTKVRLAVETTPHYFSEGIREGQVMVRTCAALWDVGYYEIDDHHSEGDLDAADTTPDSSDDESWPAEDVSQEDKFPYHYCRWLDVPPSKTSAGVPENGPTGGQRKFSVVLHGARFKNLRLTFFRKMLDSYYSKSKDPLVPDLRTRWFLYVPPPLDDDDADKAARNADTSILTGRTMEEIKQAAEEKWAAMLADFRKRNRKTYQDVTDGKSSLRSDMLECPEALEAFAAAGEF
ncbi:Golgi transport complex subunit 3 [Rhodotorula mucilaginosa]|uniref:Conserved oligomeric Golgi complex subunit 3 n=1 Tax=Rhodotorula mucilaginosa TaxID=5537 RepID=A0A9P6VTA6_RHOMI|nr:Golgi transport complex subunit 3 [Rhodotorula mucilaginosa]